MNNRLVHIDDKSREMLDRAKSAILIVEPDAEIFLFGSRARGNSNEDSDWDLLVQLPGKVPYSRKSSLIKQFYDFQLEQMVFFDIIIISKNEIQESSLFAHSPFFQDISSELITV